MNGNASVVRALLDELDALGVREYCVCAGARNAPVIAALAARGSPVRSFFDERAAAFFALGRILQGGRPVAVVTTSGTAAAELLPAVIEARYQGLPLVAVTADRPSRYRGSGAPQAIEQRDLFAGQVRARMELEWVEAPPESRLREEVMAGRAPGGEEFGDGPLHINVRLEEGLVAVDHPAVVARGRAALRAGDGDPFRGAASPEWRDFFEDDGALLVLASGIPPADAAAAGDFLARLGAPVVAEATAHLGHLAEVRHLLVRGGERALRSMAAGRVLRLGAVPSWRWWRDLDAREDVRVLNVSRAPFRGLARSAGVVTLPWEALTLPHPGATAPARGVAGIGDELDRLLEEHPHSEPAWMRRISRMIGPDARVFLGNSLPIREWNLAGLDARPGTRFFANRGANGIDGLVSTWLGVSADAAESWCVVGDLSALYDLNAPWILDRLPPAKRRIVVVNNGGGRIFARVPWLAGAPVEVRELMENPHALRFESWARMWGMEWRLFARAADLRDDDAACAVWEIRPDAVETEAFWAGWNRPGSVSPAAPRPDP